MFANKPLAQASHRSSLRSLSHAKPRAPLSVVRLPKDLGNEMLLASATTIIINQYGPQLAGTCSEGPGLPHAKTHLRERNVSSLVGSWAKHFQARL